MTNRQKAIDDFRHEVSGVWLEIVLSGAKGGELSMRLREGLRLIDRLALKLAQELQPEPIPNGRIASNKENHEQTRTTQAGEPAARP